MKIIVLGGEKQAATSLALSRPDIFFELLSDQSVIDGQDLPNVDSKWSSPIEIDAESLTGTDCVVLCGRWLSSMRTVWGRPWEDIRVSRIMASLGESLGDMVIPVQAELPAEGRWRVKGDTFHRPDEPFTWSPEGRVEPDDPYGCGMAFQPEIEVERRYLVGGWRGGNGVTLGAFRVWQEAFGREEFLLAVESVNDAHIVENSLLVIEAAGVEGQFSMSWLEESGGEQRLSSLRPWPRAWFQAFARGGLDLMSPNRVGTHVLEPGISVVVDHSYVSYRELS